MDLGRWLRRLGAACLVACGGTAPAPPAAPAPAPTTPEAGEPVHEEEPDEASTLASVATPPEPSPSSATFEQATSKPESVDVHDDRAQLTDAQLTAPMQGVFARCRVPANAKVTIRTAVQNGVAIGVTVEVEIAKPKSASTSNAQKRKKKVSKAAARAAAKAAKAEAKTKARIVACADHAVRALTWPPSHRRDTFTTVF